jgi:hypothetical protein
MIGLEIVKVKIYWKITTFGEEEIKVGGTTRFSRMEGEVTGEALD